MLDELIRKLYMIIPCIEAGGAHLIHLNIMIMNVFKILTIQAPEYGNHEKHHCFCKQMINSCKQSKY